MWEVINIILGDRLFFFRFDCSVYTCSVYGAHTGLETGQRLPRNHKLLRMCFPRAAVSGVWR